MKPKTFMLIAGEPSGDLLAAELVAAIKAAPEMQRAVFPPKFIGAGGPHMAAAGVEMPFDLTQHSVIGISEVLKKYCEFRRLLHQLVKLAVDKQPDVIIGVDFGGFNLRFAQAIRDHVHKASGEFNNWNPKIVQYVSPQVWASRPGRAQTLALNHDLLLSIFPFEKQWYAERAPSLNVEFVGHPMVERLLNDAFAAPAEEYETVAPLVLLPGSRPDELRRHVPVLLETLQLIRKDLPSLAARMVVPNEVAAKQVKELGLPATVELQVGDLARALQHADVAITKSGTVTVECAAHGVPAVVFYQTSWPTYFIAKGLVTVKYIAMPNLLANEEIYPEFIQGDATAQKIAAATVELLRDEPKRGQIKLKLMKVVESLGGPGANARAARAVVNLLR